MSAHAARISRGDGGPAAAAIARFASGAWLAVAIAAALVAMAFGATGGLEILGVGGAGLAPNITLQMSLTLAGGVALAAACLAAPRRTMPAWGAGAAFALLALAALTAISVTWSVDPANSWLEASRTFAYAATFIGAIGLVRIAASRWRSVLAGVLLATLALSAWAVAAKIVPEALQASGTGESPGAYARLSLPFNYWNAVGLTAALGIPPCLWLGARRERHGAVGALAAPALCLLLVTMLLSYSRGALAAAAVGVALWFVLVPLRLRALAVLAIGGAAAAVVAVWAFRQPALSHDHYSLPLRSYSGHRLGLVLGGALVAAFVGALIVRFAAERRPLAEARRRQLGIAALIALALVPVGGVVGLAYSSRGLGGSISHAWNSLTSPSAQQPSSNPSRLAQAGNDHALYWGYALDVFDTNPAVGAGAGSYPVADQRFLTSQALSNNAHSYIFQTLADLGIVGLLVSLVAVFAWVAAALRATGARRPRAPGGDGAERIGLVTMAAVVVAFGVHSAVDWTWFVPADAVLALLLAGWVAGRGPHDAAAARPARARLSLIARSPLSAAAAVAAIALAAMAAWAEWQPLRSEDATNAAAIALGNGVAALDTGQTELALRDYSTARSDALAAISRDPLDIAPLSELGYYYADIGDDAAATATFKREVRLQPSNTQSWQDLAYYEEAAPGRDAKRIAYNAFAVALYLDPQNIPLQRTFLQLSSRSRP